MQLEDTLTQLLKDYTKNPVVNVRFLNYNFSVMGEVSNKGRFTMQNERMTILEAISMAGDLTEFGKRDNILVIREINGKRNFARVNLLSKNLFNSATTPKTQLPVKLQYWYMAMTTFNPALPRRVFLAAAAWVAVLGYTQHCSLLALMMHRCVRPPTQ